MSDIGLRLQAAAGLCVLVGLAWAISENRRAVAWRAVAGALALQAVIALLLLKLEAARELLFALNRLVTALTDATGRGTSFVFGYAGGGPAPFAVTAPGNLVSLAFGVLPLVIVISALSALFWHWRILPVIVGGLAFVLKRTLGIGGAVGLGSAATLFLGNIEGQLVIRPYLSRFNRTELFILMTVGLSVIAGTVFVLYATILKDALPGALGHLLIASMMSLVSGIMMARIIVPGDAIQESEGGAGRDYRSSMDAVAQGTEVGLRIYLQILAMLIVAVALVALANIVLGLAPMVNGAPLTLERLLGWLFAPLVFFFGIPWREAVTAGGLMGTKTVLNELIAYLDLAHLPAGVLDERTTRIMVYAMCGFANLGSVGILIAGMSALLPERRNEIISLVMKALVAGTLASSTTGAMIGLLG